MGEKGSCPQNHRGAVAPQSKTGVPSGLSCGQGAGAGTDTGEGGDLAVIAARPARSWLGT